MLAVLPLALFCLVGQVKHSGAVTVGDKLGVDLARVSARVAIGIGPLHITHMDDAYLWHQLAASTAPLRSRRLGRGGCSAASRAADSVRTYRRLVAALAGPTAAAPGPCLWRLERNDLHRRRVGATRHAAAELLARG